MLFVYLLFQLSSLVSSQNENASDSKGDIPYHRNIRFVGGDYSTNGNVTILNNNLYVEELLPLSGVKAAEPVVFFSGGFDAGTQWLTKPDGDAGWASWFLNRGHAVYLIDTYSVGRSSVSPSPLLTPVPPTEQAESSFTAPEKSTLAKYYQKKFHNQWPGVCFPPCSI